MEIWRAISVTATNLQKSIKLLATNKISDVGGSTFYEPCSLLFSGSFNRLTSGDLSYIYDDIILAAFFGGLCVLLWHMLVLFYHVIANIIRFRGRGSRFLYRSRTNMTIPILEQIQRMDRGTGAGELRGDIRAAGDSLEQDHDPRQEVNPRIMVMFLQSPPEDSNVQNEQRTGSEGRSPNNDQQQRVLHGIMMAHDILAEIRRMNQQVVNSTNTAESTVDRPNEAIGPTITEVPLSNNVQEVSQNDRNNEIPLIETTTTVVDDVSQEVCSSDPENTDTSR